MTNKYSRKVYDLWAFIFPPELMQKINSLGKWDGDQFLFDPKVEEFKAHYKAFTSTKPTPEQFKAFHEQSRDTHFGSKQKKNDLIADTELEPSPSQINGIGSLPDSLLTTVSAAPAQSNAISLPVIANHTLCRSAKRSVNGTQLVSCEVGIYPGEFSFLVCEQACHAYKGPPRAGFDPRLDQHRYSKPRMATPGQVASFAQAALTGKYVAKETAEERALTCATCDFYRYDDNGPWCGACGCRVSMQSRQIRNLAAYEENLPGWGCKHPNRLTGKGWRFTSDTDKTKYKEYLKTSKSKPVLQK